MTLGEMGQYNWLTKEIQRDEQRLKELEEIAIVAKSPSYTGMPRGNGTTSKVELYAAEIVDLEAIIAAKRLQCIHERNRIERFIAEIDDSRTRLIFTLRCIDCMSWGRVAEYMGGGMTADTARQIYSRYIKAGRKSSKDGKNAPK